MFITGFANIWLLPGGRTNLSQPCFFKYLKGREHFPPYRFGLISALHFLHACSIPVKYSLLRAFYLGVHAPEVEEGNMLQLHAKTFSSSFDIWPSFSKYSPSSCSFRTGTRYFAREGRLPKDGPSRESSVKSFKRSVDFRIFCEKYLTVLASNKFLRSLNLTVLFISYFKLIKYIYIYIF